MLRATLKTNENMHTDKFSAIILYIFKKFKSGKNHDRDKFGWEGKFLYCVFLDVQ